MLVAYTAMASLNRGAHLEQYTAEGKAGARIFVPQRHLKCQHKGQPPDFRVSWRCNELLQLGEGNRVGIAKALPLIRIQGAGNGDLCKSEDEWRGDRHDTQSQCKPL